MRRSLKVVEMINLYAVLVCTILFFASGVLAFGPSHIPLPTVFFALALLVAMGNLSYINKIQRGEA